MIILAVSLFACNTEVNSPPGESDDYTSETDYKDTVQTEKPTEPPHVHEFGEWSEVSAPTCTAEGVEERICKECGEKEQRKTAAIPHVFTKTKVEPDCVNEGYTKFSCKCGYEYTADKVPPIPHDFTDTVVPPKCEDKGYTEHLCSECGYSYTDAYTDPLGHSFTKTTVYPTILAPGSNTYTCECSFSHTDYIFYSDILPNAYVEQSKVLAKGIDVSRWNHNLDANNNYIPLDWNAIKASGVNFVIIKAGSTKSGIEPTFEMDYEGARAAGLEIGVYFYTYSTTLEGIKKDANDLMGWLEGKIFEYPIYLDLEDPSLEALPQSLLGEMCAEFISALQAKGYYAGLYSNHNWLTYILDTEKTLLLYDIWYARYPLTESPVWNEEKYGKQLGMWQYSESGTIDGFDCAFDLNFAYKNYKDIMIKWGLNGF